MLLRIWRSVLIVSLALMAVSAFAQPTAAQSDHDDAAATLVLGLLNQWRISEGLSPLIMNPVLQQMALDQARLVLPKLDTIAYEDYHKDASGRSAIRRAIEVYNWPSYRLPERVEIGENAAEFPPQLAINFWQNSAIHRKVAANPNYREIGVAALTIRRGSYLFYTVFGSRLEVLTALVDPDSKTLYLTQDTSRYNPDRSTAPTVQIFDASRTAITQPQEWQPKLTLPSNASLPVFVLYTSKVGQQWIMVDQIRNAAILPNGTVTVSAQLAAITAKPIEADQAPGAIAAAPTETPIVAASATINLPSSTPTVSAPIAATATTVNTNLPTNTPQVAASATATATVISLPTVAPTLTPTATFTPTVLPPTATLPAVAEVDLVLFYNSRALWVQNASGRRLDITRLTVGRVAMTAWQQVASFPAASFPVNACLQVNILGAENSLPPSACNNVWSQISVSADRAFWASGMFDVKIGESVIQTCQPNVERCEIDIP